MLASQVCFEQPSDIFKLQVSHKNNISLLGAENIVATIHNASSSERDNLEQFVKALFKRSHGANIQYFMPELMALTGQDGALMAVCGLRKAEQEPLFLERYLASSIEKTISDIEGKVVSRDAITEIGNLAVARPENIRCLLASINLYMHKSNTDWAVFTGIRSLKNALTKLNIPLLSIGAAHIDFIPHDERSDWGAYYDEKPEVMAIKRIFQVK
jgi:Thermostable hemolysin